MSAMPPNGGHSSTRSRREPGSQRPTADEETRSFYSRFLGWLMLAIILGYAGLQMPLPWRLLTVAAGLFGVAGGVVLFVQCLRRNLSAMVLIGAVLATLCCGLFLFVGGLQVIFWDASAAFEECLSTAVTQRAVDSCYNDYEQDVLSLIPGMP